MKYHPALTLIFVFLILATNGCSGTDPVTPVGSDFQNSIINSAHPGTSLWSYYSVVIDPDTETVTANLNRDLLYSLNVNVFLNKNPATISFEFNGVTPGPGYLDVDLNVSITHPIPEKEKFNGYDVRGVLVGNGSAVMIDDPEITYPILGIDQYLLNADGYTRWFNKVEFYVQGLFGFTPGIYGTPALEGTATINGYKYFADGLGPYDDVYETLKENDGVFISGSTNTRNYVIRFPVPDPGLKFDYAVIADWSGGNPEDHPSHAAEAVAASIEFTRDIFYSETAGGSGDLEFNLGITNWNNQQPSSAYIESTVLSAAFWQDMTWQEPWESGANFAVWHFDIPADAVETVTGNELVAVIEYAAFDHTNPFDIPNTADSPLRSYFRFDVPVQEGVPVNHPPEITAGVGGSETTTPTAFMGYFCAAWDPEGDDVIYSWVVTDTSDDSVVFTDDSDTDGVLFITWGTDIVAEVGDIYDVDCHASDSYNPPVAAETLTVTVVPD